MDDNDNDKFAQRRTLKSKISDIQNLFKKNTNMESSNDILSEKKGIPRYELIQ